MTERDMVFYLKGWFDLQFSSGEPIKITRSQQDKIRKVVEATIASSGETIFITNLLAIIDHPSAISKMLSSYHLPVESSSMFSKLAFWK